MVQKLNMVTPGLNPGTPALLKFLEHVDLVIFFTAVHFKTVSELAKNLEKRAQAWIWPKKSISKKTLSWIFSFTFV